MRPILRVVAEVTDTSHFAASGVSAIAVVTGAGFLGESIATWIGAVSGVLFFMVSSSNLSIAKRLALFVPASAGTAFGADTLVTAFGWSPKAIPFVAFVFGLVIVVAALALIQQSQKRGSMSAAFRWILEKLLSIVPKK